MTDPLHQFQIHVLAPLFKIGGIQFNFTNSAVFMLAIVAIICALLYAAFARADLVPSRLQAAGEVWYEFVQDMVRQVMGEDGMKFFPLVFTIFSFVLFANMLGMFPYFFTVTSHVIVTAALAVFVILLVIAVGLMRHGLGLVPPFRAPWRARRHPALHLGDRGHLVSVAPGEPGAAVVRQHAGRPHRPQGLCRVRGLALGARHHWYSRCDLPPWNGGRPDRA